MTDWAYGSVDTRIPLADFVAEWNTRGKLLEGALRSKQNGLQLFDPMDYGAAGKLATDDTAAVARAIAAWKASTVANTGGALLFTHPHLVSTADIAGVNGGVVVSLGGSFFGQSTPTTGTGTVSAVAGAATFSTSQTGILSNGVNITVAGVNYRVSALASTTATLIPPPGVTATFGASAFTYNPDTVFGIRNCTDVSVLGRLAITGQYNPSYDAGLAVYTDNGTSCTLLNIQNPAVSGVRVAYRFGRSTEPNSQISEIMVGGGYTNGCPTVCEAYGTQTVVAIDASQLIAGAGSGNAAWAALTQYGIRVFGATVMETGGEAQHNTNTTGAMYCLEPITDAVNGNSYGSIYASDVQIEAASRLGLAQNTLGVVTPLVGSGVLSIRQCTGYHASDSFPFIDMSAASFTGRVNLGGGGNFFAGVARSQPTISCAGAADIHVEDDGSVGKNFPVLPAGITGGVLHYTGPRATVTPTTTYAATRANAQIRADATAAGFTVTLPDAAGHVGQVPLTIKKTDATANVVTIAAVGADTIEGTATKTLAAQWKSYTLSPRTGGWDIVAAL